MSVVSEVNKLLAECKKGKSAAQKGMYDLFAPRMLVVALRYSKTTHEAEDVLQEAFLKVFKSISKLREHEKLEGWIKKIVVNTALNQNRSKLYMFPMAEISEFTKIGSEEVDLSSLHFKELLSMIQELPTGCQVIFNLFAIEGYSHKEIAEKLDISVGTSKSQYSRARGLLQEMVKKAQKVNYGTV
jgi:RNA polymerase sigma-70 factor (ECF subfamily)